MILSKQKITVFVLGFIIVAVFLVKWFIGLSSSKIDPVAARAKGPENAKVKVVEFIDFECPACANGAKILKSYMEQYPDDLQVQVKHYPLMNMHRHAMQSASYVECLSRQGKFWPFFDLLMPQQAQWSQLINVEGIFDQMAQGVGANMGQLKSCVSSQDVTTTIMSEKALGRSLGVQSTPTYFINDKMVVGTKSLQEELDLHFPKKI